MKTNRPQPWTVKDLVQLKRDGFLNVDPEYQRGLVWKPPQQKRLIDSVMRGYPLPMIYLLKVEKTVRGTVVPRYDIIDGQQRINALHEFHENKWELFDPKLDAKVARFPKFIEQQPCDWARKRFEALDVEWQERFLATEMAVVEIEAAESNEARDLFVRLQAGLPLTAQEKRDAWPGHLPVYIARIAGRHNDHGHAFFSMVKRSGGGKKIGDGEAGVPADSRGAIRQLCAGWLMLFMERWSKGADAFLDINNKRIDEFYYEHIDFDKNSREAKKFERLLQKGYEVLFRPKARPFKPYEALHLLLLIDLLIDDYAPSWEGKLYDAMEKFRERLSEATKKSREDDNPGQYWTRFGQFLYASSDRRESIATRHEFFVTMMLGFLEPLAPLDKTRIFGPVEREYIFYRDKKKCQVCEQDLAWSDMEVHHVDGHAGGGKTTVGNGAAVHIGCHPKSRADVDDFAKKWRAKRR